MALPYRALEKALYEIGGPPEARPAQPHLRVIPRHVSPGPRGPFRESIQRIDLSLAVRQLSAAEIEVVKRHYILKVQRYRRSEREPIIRKLASILEGP